MRSESKLLAYKSEGLPADDLSMENGTVILESTQTCLIIDPAQQAPEWLKTQLTNQHATERLGRAVPDHFGAGRPVRQDPHHLRGGQGRADPLPPP